MKKKKRKINPNKDGIDTINNILSTVLKNRKLNDSFYQFTFLNKCIKRLGEEFSKHMVPYSFRSGILFCNVDSPVWNHQYTMMKNIIIEKLNEEPCEQKIDDIRFKVGSLKNSAYILDEKKEKNLSEDIDKQILNEEDQIFIDDLVNEINPELKEISRNTLEIFLKYQKYRED